MRDAFTAFTHGMLRSDFASLVSVEAMTTADGMARSIAALAQLFLRATFGLQLRTFSNFADCLECSLRRSFVEVQTVVYHDLFRLNFLCQNVRYTNLLLLA